MRLTTKTRFAVRAMADLATQPKGKATPLRDIAERQTVDAKYLELILFKLRQADLIATKKGPGGGYLLTRDPKSIKIGDIMEAVGESRAPVHCVERGARSRCPRINNCPTRPHWRRLRQTIDAFFDSLTLQDILLSYRKRSNK